MVEDFGQSPSMVRQARNPRRYAERVSCWGYSELAEVLWSTGSRFDGMLQGC